MDVPVRHGEGRFVAADGRVLDELGAGHLAAARYVPRDGGAGPAAYPDNPNGSVDGIAGICDRTGRVFGLMPHPEAFLFPENHPEWTRGQDAQGRPSAGPGDGAGDVGADRRSARRRGEAAGSRSSRRRAAASVATRPPLTRRGAFPYDEWCPAGRCARWRLGA